MMGPLCLSLVLIPVAAIAGSWLSRIMKRLSLGQQIRDYGPEIHQKKSGTPTMGGIIILILWGGSFLIISELYSLSRQGLFILLAGLCFGGIGLLDDLISLLNKRSQGLSPWQKILLGTGIAIVLFIAFPGMTQTPLMVPFSSITIPLSSFVYLLLTWAIFSITTNSMNLTDGLDGLATGVSIIILTAYLILFPAGDSGKVLLPLIGILVGFLWVNFYPARIFLGDTGSFALGGVVGALAIASGTLLFLPLLAGLLILESASVVLQVSYFKFTGRRIFKVSPLHHHFEHAIGIDYPYLLPQVEWPEPKITLRLWILQALFTGLGILALRL
ncbi:MAG: phospho-N-acetylmuramoyl-pentapeptide-transferase [Candidatus Bipolaricaulota bacterium]|nr:phospho-N-acetylmuramoyl-pentapeptide-transferase [Candidatus Bipolaricaulota bacterium]